MQLLHPFLQNASRLDTDRVHIKLTPIWCIKFHTVNKRRQWWIGVAFKKPHKWHGFKLATITQILTIGGLEPPRKIFCIRLHFDGHKIRPRNHIRCASIKRLGRHTYLQEGYMKGQNPLDVHTRCQLKVRSLFATHLKRLAVKSGRGKRDYCTQLESLTSSQYQKVSILAASFSAI